MREKCDSGPGDSLLGAVNFTAIANSHDSHREHTFSQTAFGILSLQCDLDNALERHPMHPECWCWCVEPASHGSWSQSYSLMHTYPSHWLQDEVPDRNQGFGRTVDQLMLIRFAKGVKTFIDL